MVQFTAVLFNNGATQAQAQSHTFFTCGEKWGTQHLCHILGNTTPLIGHGKLHFALGGNGCSLNGKCTMADVGVLHGLHTIARQVQHDLFDHGGVTYYGG